MIYLIEITPFRIEFIKGDVNYAFGDKVVFESSEGIDIGRIIKVQEEEGGIFYGEILRHTTPEDLEKKCDLKKYEEFCLNEFKDVVHEYNLAMKPVYTHCQFDEERIIFYFTAEKKMEFRKLHRRISQKLNKRVVIKQIGARDFARIFGGVGPCGRKLCCATFLSNLKSISLRMAREQKLYVSPSKLSGICGKLLCCLNFEEDFYSDLQNIAQYQQVSTDAEEDAI